MSSITTIQTVKNTSLTKQQAIDYKNHNGQPVVTSLMVAKKFEIKHNEVLKRINADLNIVFRDTEGSATLSYTDDSGKKNPMFALNRDEFERAAMMLPNTRPITLARIQILDTLKEQAEFKMPSTLLEAGKLWVNEMAAHEITKQDRDMYKGAVARLASSGQVPITIRESAKLLELRPCDLTEYLINTARWIFIQGDSKLPYQAIINQGLMVQTVHRYEKTNGEYGIKSTPKITPKGLSRLSQMLEIDL